VRPSLVYRHAVAVLCAAALGLGAAVPAGGAPTVSETDLKAALVLNFMRYVDWPERAFATREAPMVICLMGRDTENPAFTALEARQSQGRPVKVRHGVPLEDTRGCHAAVFFDVQERRLAPALKAMAGQPVLTIGDSEGFVDSGGAIGVVSADQRLQFEVNRAALDQAQLKASSHLLKLARAVLNAGN
jgi:hypothetical protein